MKKTAEITWSLMHPTPLDPDYMRRVVQKSAEYRVDSFEICAACHSLLGGMDGLLLYEDFPHAAAKIDRAAILKNRETLREVLNIAHAAGKPVYYWHREVMVPDGLLTDLPSLLDGNGEFDFFGEAFGTLLRYKIDRTFAEVPELDGLVLTLTEADYSVIHNSNAKDFPPVKVVERIVSIFAEELRKRNRHFVLRSFGSIAQDYEDIISGGAAAAKKFPFEIETKITPYDFDPFLPVNPFLRAVPGTTLGAECDCLGEFLGAGFLPAENVDNIVRYVRNGQAAGVSRYAIRLDRVGNSVFDAYEINLYAYARAVDDPDVTAEDIRREWADRHYPGSARMTFLDLGLDGFSVVKKTHFLDGNVIFHQFPISRDFRIPKAGYAFALFKENIDLHLGQGIWSILSANRTPGRKALLAEKDAAVSLAKAGLARLAALPREPGYEAEYVWRERLWKNACAATEAVRAFCRCVAAYFDDMESHAPEPKRLTLAIAEAEKLFADLAETPLEESAEPGKFVNGMGHDLFRRGKTVRDAYLEPLHILVSLLPQEYAAEFSARDRYAPGTCDCVVCGGLADDWRCGRYMHGSHARLLNGFPVRYAGNRVFPNGFIDLELVCPGEAAEVLFRSDPEAEEKRFSVEIDGVRRDCVFDAEGFCTLDATPREGLVKIRLAKAPGADYPSFRVVAAKQKSRPSARPDFCLG
ncbi:MAG: hypothetical protein IJS01_12590 [Lentisphaeria bacterium]|nr:hypothetical protein [Lentisphaeria bacterium]